MSHVLLQYLNYLIVQSLSYLTYEKSEQKGLQTWRKRWNSQAPERKHRGKVENIGLHHDFLHVIPKAQEAKENGHVRPQTLKICILKE